MKRLSTTLKVRLISNFLQLIITTAFIPFIALYLTDMLSQSIVGIYLVGLVVLKFPLSIISGYLIEIFPKKLLVLIYQATMVIMLVFMGVFGSHQFVANYWFLCCICHIYNRLGITISSYGHINYGCNYRRRGTLYLQD